MKNTEIRRRMLFTMAALAAAGIACSSSSNSSPGTGGHTATGGATGSGGSMGSGGATTGTGGGAGAAGGAGPTDGGLGDAGIVPSFAYTFDTTAQGWTLNTFLPSAPQVNLAAPDSGSAPTLTFDSAVGNPTPGSVKVSATFTSYRQLVDAIIGPRPPLNLAGKTIHARVMLTGTFTGGSGAILHASSTAGFIYGSGAYTTLTPNVWTNLSLDVSAVTATGWDPTNIVQVGIQFYTGDPPEAGTYAAPNDVVFHIDEVTDGTGDVTRAPVSYTFDTTNPGFQLNNFVPGAPQVNLAAPDASAPPTLAFDGTDGNPTAGSLRMSATFSDYQQLVDVVIGPFPSLSLAGKVLHAKVKLTSGTFDGATGAGATLHASTGAFIYGSGAYTALTLGTWTDLTMDFTAVTATGWDPTNVVQIGIQLYTGGRPEAGTFLGPNQVVINIDSITE